MNYQKIYDELIQKRKLNKLVKGNNGSIEQHHIIPLCISHNNDKSNLINLTCREHYIAHLLLSKIYEHTPYSLQMYTAVTKMRSYSKNHKNGRNFHINSRLYEAIRKQRAIEFSKYYNNMPIEKKKEISQKISNKRKGKLPGSTGKILVSNEQLSTSIFIDPMYLDHYINDLGFIIGMRQSSKKSISDGQRGYKYFYNIKTKEIRRITNDNIHELNEDWAPGTGINRNNFHNKGKIYITNMETGENKQVDSFDDIPQGWIPGRTQKHKKKIWIMNSITNECRRIDATDDIPIGWKRGKIQPKSLYQTYKNRNGTKNLKWIHNVKTKKRKCISKDMIKFYIYESSDWKLGYKMTSS